MPNMESKALRSILKYYDTGNGELLVGGTPISRLAERHGTPLYVYDLSVARTKYQRLRASLPPEIEVHYAIKANPHPEIVKFFLDLGAGFDVASMGELRTVVSIGADSEQCGFAGPGKGINELEYAIELGIGALNVESYRELELAGQIAERLGTKANVSLRINPAFHLRGAGVRIGGGAHAFGIDQEQIPGVLTRIAGMKHLNFAGFHLFAGSQNLKPEPLIEFFTLSFGLLKELLNYCPKAPKLINLGGGFGIPYLAKDEELDIELVGQGLRKLVTQYRPVFPEARFSVESGRYLIGEAGVYVARVRYRKTSRGETFLVTDGGLHHHLAATGNFGQVIQRNYPIALLQKLEMPDVERVNIVGPLCTPLDILGAGVDLPEAAEGDLIGIFASGAYGFSASPRGFLSHPEPMEIVAGM
jgi:diaminopimelate decarboxylase